MKNKNSKWLVLWDWWDFGVCFKICKNTNISDYHLGLDIQVAWFNLWIEFIRRDKKIIMKLFRVQYWIYVADGYDSRDVEIMARNEEDAIVRIKKQVPFRAKGFEII